MSVLIKGMSMPKEGCKDCVMVKRGLVFDICPFLRQEVNGNVERGGKPNGCPLIDVPDTNDGDLISRQAAIDELKECRKIYCDNTPESFSLLGHSDKSRVDEIDNAIAILVDLPSAQPELKVGEWIVVKRHEHYPSGKPYEQVQCPFCKRFDHNGDGNFCGYCGAKMKGTNDKRGEWIDEPVYKQTMDGKTWDGFTYCSECKEMHEYGYRSNYCPNCGAMMDERSEDGEIHNC